MTSQALERLVKNAGKPFEKSGYLRKIEIYLMFEIFDTYLHR